MKDGILVLDKPEGKSSTQMVKYIKRRLLVRKVGHGGTLDPFATGVLPICIGRGTKIARFILEGDKEYQGIFKFGIETETYDLTGKVLAHHPIPDLRLSDIQKVFNKFIGIIEQRPPAYSATKFHGRPLYKYAREGLKIEKPPKKVEVLEFRAIEYSPPLVHFYIYCSKGTYIRALVHEVGEIIGCGATLVDLRRLRKGPFTIEQAISIDEFEKLFKGNHIEEKIVPIAKALEFIPALIITPEIARQIRQGRPLPFTVLNNMIRFQKVPRKQRIPWLRLITLEGSLVAVLEYPEDLSKCGKVKMIRVFTEASS